MKKLFIIVLLCSVFRISSAPPNITTARNSFNVHDEYEKHRQKMEKKRFCDSMAFHESRSNPRIVNKIGCVGLFQFGAYARKITGYGHITKKDFIWDAKARSFYLKDLNIWPPDQQYKAMDSLISINHDSLNREIQKYEGKIINGTKITKSGILAAAHLSGYDRVKHFLNTNGHKNAKDMNGTSIKTYMARFSNFNF